MNKLFLNSVVVAELALLFFSFTNFALASTESDYYYDPDNDDPSFRPSYNNDQDKDNDGKDDDESDTKDDDNDDNNDDNRDDNDDYSKDSYDKGYEDGLNNPFDQSIFDEGNSKEDADDYTDGFNDGCLSVEGNDKDVCNSAEDAGDNDNNDDDNDNDKKPNKYGDEHCDNSYPDVCIDHPPPNLNCDDIPNYRNFKVIGDDPHGFDGDNDGKGCETSSGSNSGSKSNNNNNDDHDSNNNDNSKSSSSSSSSTTTNVDTKKFQVQVVLDNVTTAESDEFRMRVIVYGNDNGKVLNKPTLDKPGQLVNVQGCGFSCYIDWNFTAWKVPIGSEIQACVWNFNTGHQNCGYGNSTSQYGPEIIHVSLPSVS